MDTSLDKFERGIGLPSLGEPSTEVLSLLQLTKAQLRGMTAEDCSEASALLAQYSFFLQRVTNREKTHVDWCNENINAIVRPRLSQQKGWSFEERKLLAIHENDAARKLEGMQVQAQTRLNRISFLASKVENTSRRLAELAETKKRQHG